MPSRFSFAVSAALAALGTATAAARPEPKPVGSVNPGSQARSIGVSLRVNGMPVLVDPVLAAVVHRFDTGAGDDRELDPRIANDGRLAGERLVAWAVHTDKADPRRLGSTSGVLFGLGR